MASGASSFLSCFASEHCFPWNLQREFILNIFVYDNNAQNLNSGSSGKLGGTNVKLDNVQSELTELKSSLVTSQLYNLGRVSKTFCFCTVSLRLVLVLYKCRRIKCGRACSSANEHQKMLAAVLQEVLFGFCICALQMSSPVAQTDLNLCS